MNILQFCIVLIILTRVVSQNCTVWARRLSFGQDYMSAGSNQLYIAFNTDDDCLNSYVLYGGSKILSNSKKLITPTITFVTNVHWVAIQGINFEGDYFSSNYQVVGVDASLNESPTDVTNFKLVAKHIQGQYQVLAMGDWGLIYPNVSAIYDNIFPTLQRFVSSNIYAFAIYLGDMAYDLCDESNKTCVKYTSMLTAMQFLTKSIPFMITIGNHQIGSKYLNAAYLFKNTFLTPTRQQDSYYFEVGNVHFQTFNAFEEAKLNNNSMTTNKVATLINFNSNKGKEIDWTIAYGHYPFFCQNNKNDTGCATNSYNVMMSQFLQYFDQYHVDLYYGAHLHLFLRTLPINSLGQVGVYEDLSNRKASIFYNAKSPVHIYEGSAGNSNFLTTQNYPLENYTASQFVNAGFSIMTVNPAENIIQNQHIFGKNGSVAETFILIKNSQTYNYGVVSVSVAIFIIGILVLWGMIKGTQRYNLKIRNENETTQLREFSNQTLTFPTLEKQKIESIE